MSDIKNQERVDFVMWAKDSLNSTCFAYDELIDSLKEQEEDTDVFAAAWIAMAIEDNLENHGPDGYEIDYIGDQDDCFDIYSDALVNAGVEFNDDNVLKYLKAYADSELITKKG